MTEDTTPETADETTWREQVNARHGDEARAYLATAGTGDPETVVAAFDDVAQVAQYAKTYAVAGVYNAACRLLDRLRVASEQTAMHADDLRARLIDAELAVVHELTPEGRPNFVARDNIEAADLALAELATDPGDLTARMAPIVLRWVREIDEDRSSEAGDAELVSEMTAELLAVRDERVAHLAARLAEAEYRAEEAEERLSAFDDQTTRWEREKARADRAEEQLREERNRNRVAAEKDVCTGCMQREEQRDQWAEMSRQNGIKYERMKQAWHREQNRARAAEAQVAALQRELAEVRAAAEQFAAEGNQDLARFNQYREWTAEVVAEKDAAVAAVRTAQITHIRDTHPDRMHVANCLACHVLVPLSAAMPSRPDDPEEIRRLAQATESTEEETDA